MNPRITQTKRIAGSRFFTRGRKLLALRLFAAAVASILVCSTTVLKADDNHYLPDPVRPVSTVPANGDGNPYGVAFVPPGFPAGGMINPGDILVSNFNASSGLQGTGTTIVDVPP